MSISNTVAELSRRLGNHAGSARPDVALGCAKLQQMTRFVGESRLDLWEESLAGMRETASASPEHAAMVAIMELGRINLFGDIDEELTAEYLATATVALRAAGVTVPDTAFDVTDW